MTSPSVRRVSCHRDRASEDLNETNTTLYSQLRARKAPLLSLEQRLQGPHSPDQHRERVQVESLHDWCVDLCYNHMKWDLIGVLSLSQELHERQRPLRLERRLRREQVRWRDPDSLAPHLRCQQVLLWQVRSTLASSSTHADSTPFPAACNPGYTRESQACVKVPSCKASLCRKKIPTNSHHTCKNGDCAFSASPLLACNPKVRPEHVRATCRLQRGTRPHQRQVRGHPHLHHLEVYLSDSGQLAPRLRVEQVRFR